jgi:hypothetical protein
VNKNGAQKTGMKALSRVSTHDWRNMWRIYSDGIKLKQRVGKKERRLLAHIFKYTGAKKPFLCVVRALCAPNLFALISSAACFCTLISFLWQGEKRRTYFHSVPLFWIAARKSFLRIDFCTSDVDDFVLN